MKKKVYIIILNYQSYKDTLAYIDNLQSQKCIELKILVVDNNSPNNSFELLKGDLDHIKNIEVIKSERNGGYAYGNNYGLKHIKNEKFDYTIISNNDVIISDKYLIRNLITEYQSLESPAFIAPLMINNKKKGNVSAWRIPTIKEDIIDTLQVLKLVNTTSIFYKFKNLKKNQKVDCLPGSFFMCRKEIFYKINLLDEATFLYGEETILAHKVKKIGLNNYLVQALNYQHLTSKTISSELSLFKMRRHLFESRYHFHKNHMHCSHLLLKLYVLIYYISVPETYIVRKIKKFFELYK